MMQADTRTLSNVSSGRDNNFNVLRLAASAMVLISHSFALSTGKRELEPFVREIGLTLGTIAVDIFFVTSGYLVTASLLQRRRITDFLLARALRIYPGLLVSQILTVLAVGLWFTTLSISDFFVHRDTWHYLLKNSVLVRYVDFTLPGAFQSVPFKGEVNSSLWTLPVELKMYFLLGVAWYLLWAIRRNSLKVFKFFCFGLAIVAVSLDLAAYALPTMPLSDGGTLWSLTGKFFTGAALRLFHDRVLASRRLAIFMTVALIAATTDLFLFGIIYKLVVAYLVLYFALVPRWSVLRLSLGGDYSYGIYIYAYPIQQAIITMWRGIEPLQLLFTSAAITFIFAFLSWHLVEKEALRLKSRVRGKCVPTSVADGNK